MVGIVVIYPDGVQRMYKTIRFIDNDMVGYLNPSILFESEHSKEFKQVHPFTYYGVKWVQDKIDGRTQAAKKIPWFSYQHVYEYLKENNLIQPIEFKEETEILF